MGYPCTVVSGADFSKLVLVYTVHGNIVGFLVVFDRDLSCHTSHSVDTSSVAGLDQ